MLNIDRIRQLAESYSPQEVFAALIWQRRFNLFDGPEIITDLANHPELWRSFLFAKPVYAPDENGLSFSGLLDMLLAMANYRPMPEANILRFVSYPADTLYVLAENQDTIVAQLLDLGKKWQADEVTAFDSSQQEEDWRFREDAALQLRQGLWGQGSASTCDGILLSYWWD
ncbi:MAG: hypothetical protein Q6L60_09790 [Thermostichus sp. HHBFW_bins_43]